MLAMFRSTSSSKIMTILFKVTFILVIIQHPAANSDDGSGGDETLTPFLLECRRPEYVNPSQHQVRVNLTQEKREQLVIEGRCFSACISAVTSGTNIMWNTELSDYWPFIGFNQVECQLSERIHACTSGCIRRQIESGLSRRECPLKCNADCSENIVCDALNLECYPWIRSGCNSIKNCNHGSTQSVNHPCQIGCHIDIKESIADGNPPPDPNGAPTLIKQKYPGLFSVDLSDATPSLQSNATPNSPVAFLFQFEDVNTQDLYFNWTASPVVQFNLETFACRNLLVSFAVVNSLGRSGYSESLNITVHGDERLIPNPPTQIQISDRLDTRIGFFGHAILNLSWERPQNDAYVDNFTIIVTPNDANDSRCDAETWNTTIFNNFNILSVQATSSDSRSLPVISCRYTIQIHAVGHDGESRPLTKVYSPEAMLDPDMIGFDCQRLWVPPEFAFNLTWTFPPFLHYNNVISKLAIAPKFKDGNVVLTSNTLDAISVPFPQKSTRQFSKILSSTDHDGDTLYYLPQNISSRSYYIETFIVWNDTLPYRPKQHNYTCTESAILNDTRTAKTLKSSIIAGSTISAIFVVILAVVCIFVVVRIVYKYRCNRTKELEQK